MSHSFVLWFSKILRRSDVFALRRRLVAGHLLICHSRHSLFLSLIMFWISVRRYLDWFFVYGMKTHLSIVFVMLLVNMLMASLISGILEAFGLVIDL